MRTNINPKSWKDKLHNLTHPSAFRMKFSDIPYGCRRCGHEWQYRGEGEPDCPICGWNSRKCLKCLSEVGSWRGACKVCGAVAMDCWYCAKPFIKFDDNYIYYDHGVPFGLCQESRDWPNAQWRERWKDIQTGHH